jgi:hypothetical protein
MNKRGIAILAMMFLIWGATLVGYGVRRAFIDPPKVERVQTDNVSK